MVLDRRAPHSDQGWHEGCVGAAAAPLAAPRLSATSQVMLLRQGWSSWSFASPTPHLSHFIKTHLLSPTTQCIYKLFQCFVFGNSFRKGKSEGAVPEKLWEPCSVWVISRLKYFPEVWSFLFLFFFPLWASSSPLQGDERKQIESKWVGKGYSFMGKSCWFSLQMCWSIDWCTRGKTQLLQKCSPDTAQLDEPPLLVSTLSSQLQNYWFKCFAIDCTIKAWVGEGTYSQLWYSASLFMTQRHVIYVCCCWMGLKCVFRRDFPKILTLHK